MFTEALVGMFAPLLALALAVVDEQELQERTVELPSTWTVGTRFDVTLVKGRLDYEGDTLVKDLESTSQIEVEVVRASGDGHVFRWTLSQLELPESASTNPLARDMAQIMQGAVLDLETDAYGTVQSLVNTRAVRRRIKEAFKLLRSSLISSGIHAAALGRVLTPVRESMLGEGMEALLINEPRIFTAPAGGSYVLGKEQAYEELLPIPLTGELVPAEAAFQLEQVDDEANSAVLLWWQNLDPEKTALVMNRYLQNMAREAGLEKPEDEEPLSIEIRDKARFVYDLATGIPRSVSWSRTSKVGPNQRIDWLRFEATPAR